MLVVCHWFFFFQNFKVCRNQLCVTVHDSVSLCFVSCLMFWYFVPFLCLLSVLLCLFRLPSCMFVSLCLSVLFPSCFFLCVLPSWSHLSPSVLSPHLFLVPSSVCSVYLSLCSPFALCQFVVCVMSPSSSLSFYSCLWFWISAFFWVWFKRCLFVRTLSDCFICYIVFFGPWINFCLLHSAFC